MKNPLSAPVTKVVTKSTHRIGKLSARTGAAFRGLGWLASSLVLALLVITWSGCGSNSGPQLIPGAPSTPPGNYNITITGSSAVGNQQLQLNIKVI